MRIVPRGFSLVEILVAVVIFGLLGVAIYTMGTAAVKGIRLYRQTATVAALAEKYMEVARNLPYSQVGTISGNPHGALPDVPNALTVSYGTAKYLVYYAVSNMSDPTDGAVPRADYKQTTVYIKDLGTGKVDTFSTIIAPNTLLTQLGGALSIQVINAVGQPVPGATLHITNSSITPALNVTRTTDSMGMWVEAGLPTSTNAYHITSTKAGYSTDSTLPGTVSNPNPVKPDATVLGNQVTAISFAIDQQSALALDALDETCQPLSGVGLELQGSKLVGANPNLLKFDQTYTSDSNGQVLLNPFEWDSYTPTTTPGSYMIYGSFPIQQINLLPGTSQEARLILGPTTPNSLLVIVKDSSGNPIQGATVELQNGGGYDVTKLTAGSILYQQDWSGGAGQNDFTNTDEYSADDSNVDVTTLPIGVRLIQDANGYVASGSLTSSSFDTGTGSTTYSTLTWNPTSQSASTSIKFQLATNNDDATWNFVGPDGTAGSYYTVPGTSISAANNNERYLRYKVFLGSTSTTTTPVLSNITVNYVSGCFTPGQAFFPGLSAGNTYTLTISMPGFATQTLNGLHVSGYNSLQVPLSP
jgi:prepilin-type N-terminal cleavage/methylation domain-containing protein